GRFSRIEASWLGSSNKSDVIVKTVRAIAPLLVILPPHPQPLSIRMERGVNMRDRAVPPLRFAERGSGGEVNPYFPGCGTGVPAGCTTASPAGCSGASTGSG